MEECANLGLAKSIGVSNFNSQQLDRLLEKCKIKPVANQVEANPNINQKKLIEFCTKRDIVIVGYCPLGRGNSGTVPKPTILDPKVKAIGEKYGKTPAQVVLNYLVIIYSFLLCIIHSSKKLNHLEDLLLYTVQFRTIC